QQRVGDVVPTRQTHPDGDLNAPAGRPGQEPLAETVRLDRLRVPGRVRLAGERERHPARTHQPAYRGVVQIEHLRAAATVEEPGLRGEVVLDIGMEVQMIKAEVGERADGEADPADAPVRQGVA